MFITDAKGVRGQQVVKDRDLSTVLHLSLFRITDVSITLVSGGRWKQVLFNPGAGDYFGWRAA